MHSSQPMYFFFVQSLQHFKSDLDLFSLEVSPDFILYLAPATFANVKISFFLKSVLSPVSLGVVLTEFCKVLTVLFHHSKISFSSWKMCADSPASELVMAATAETGLYIKKLLETLPDGQNYFV